jgi:hypothetical protein
MLCTEIVSDIQKNLCTQPISPCSAKRKAPEQDLTVLYAKYLSVFMEILFGKDDVIFIYLQK